MTYDNGRISDPRGKQGYSINRLKQLGYGTGIMPSAHTRRQAWKAKQLSGENREDCYELKEGGYFHKSHFSKCQHFMKINKWNLLK